MTRVAMNTVQHSRFCWMANWNGSVQHTSSVSCVMGCVGNHQNSKHIIIFWDLFSQQSDDYYACKGLMTAWDLEFSLIYYFLPDYRMLFIEGRKALWTIYPQRNVNNVEMKNDFFFEVFYDILTASLLPTCPIIIRITLPTHQNHI